MKENKTLETMNFGQNFKDFAVISICTFALSNLAVPYKKTFIDFFNKSGLVAGKSPEESLAELTAHSMGNFVTGFYSGFTDRYFIPSVFFLISLIPELFNSYEEDLGIKIKRIAFKTGIVYGGWALGKLGRKFYDFGKEIYELNTNPPGRDLFKHY